MEYLSHVDGDRKENLIEHLKETADLASFFARAFSAEKIGRQAALFHDLGKHTLKFQNVLNGKEFHIDHAIVGAECYWNEASCGEEEIVDDEYIAEVITNCIQSHHDLLHGCLLPDFPDEYGLYPESYEKNSLITKTGKENALGSDAELSEILKYIKDNHLIQTITEKDHPDVETMSKEARMLYERMVFSCLVDADYSATSAFYTSIDYQSYKDAKTLKPKECLLKLDEYRGKRGYGKDDTGMNGLRNLVYRDCTLAGKAQDPELCTLTAPTGTGKTHALIKFALEQAKRNGQERIFVVLPYLSIIEQNASEYRDIFGAENVLEDDSQAELPDELRLNADRWDYPIIVTTSVKFFETLCGAKASRLRKLHQLANSVIVFDESQTLPSDLLDVTMNTLSSLPEYFHTTVLLSTATQPDYSFRANLKDLQTKEIVEDTKGLYQMYSDVRKCELSADVQNKVTYEELMGQYSDTEQLFVFNTTKKARNMYQRLICRYPKESCFMLSSSLCSQHKTDTIRTIKDRLKNHQECYVASTQCIEAGVNLDFETGMREFAPFSSVVQTAGRVNREGKHDGKMHIFRLNEDEKYGFPSEVYRNESYVTGSLINRHGIDLNNLMHMKEYYQEIFSGDAEESKDQKQIREAVDDLDTKELSEHYHLIDEREEFSVIVPYLPEKKLFDNIYEILQATEFCITSKDMKLCRAITVNVIGNPSLREYLLHHCQQLYMRSHEYGGREAVDWFIAEDKSIYDSSTGLQRKEMEGGYLL